MLDVLCYYGGNRRHYSIIELQNLSEIELTRLRYSLKCPSCLESAFYRKESSDGKSVCFGSGDCTSRTKEISPQRGKENKDAREVDQIIVESERFTLNFTASNIVQDKKKLQNPPLMMKHKLEDLQFIF